MERGHGVRTRVEEPEIYCERRRRGEGGWESKNEMWTKPDVESGSVFPSCLWTVVYNEVPRGASWIQTRSDRKTTPSQQPPLLSPLTCLLSALSPSLSGLWLSHLHSAFSLQASIGPWVPMAHVCRPGGNVSVFERQWRCNQSEWNPKAQQERDGDRLSPYHIKRKKL